MDKNFRYITSLKARIIKEYIIFVSQSNAGKLPDYSSITDKISILDLYKTGTLSLSDLIAHTSR